jgi:hypothetical protein
LIASTLPDRSINLAEMAATLWFYRDKLDFAVTF